MSASHRPYAAAKPAGGRFGMLLVAAAAVGAALLAWARKGTLDALASTHFVWSGLVLEGLLIQVAFGIWSPAGLTRSGSVWVLVLTNLAIGGFILANARIQGMLIAGIGLLMNMTVIVANGAMPVSTGAAEAAGISAPAESSAFKHERMDEDTRVPWLGDVIPLPILGEVWSAGDFVLAAGIARVIYARMLTQRRLGSDEGAG